MIRIISATEKPISHIGRCAAVCYGKPINDICDDNDYERGMKCIKDNHGRALEYSGVTVEISGYSARVIRELYTHIVGTTRLQESTRFINMDEFEYFTPPSVMLNKESLREYEHVMQTVQHCYNRLISTYGIPVEDAANILPLGTHTRIVLDINVRAMIHLAEERFCSRAYHEFKGLMFDFVGALIDYAYDREDDEWLKISHLLMPKCERLGYCPESRSCGRRPSKEEFLKAYEIVDAAKIAVNLKNSETVASGDLLNDVAETLGEFIDYCRDKSETQKTCTDES